MTARRPPANTRTLSPREWERLLRERSYLRPIPEVEPLHVMAKRRTLPAGTDSQAVDNNPKELTMQVHADDELLDAKRDAVALFRATLAADHEASRTIVEHTRCQGCLAVQAAVLGIVLAAEGLHLDDTGHIAGDDPELDADLVAMLDGLNDPEAGSS